MASEQQIKAFIEQIAPCAQHAYKTLGKVLPSVCIGMACVECGYGTAGSVRHHSYLGHKVGSGKTATRYWGGSFFLADTKEEYTIGQHTTIKAAFRAYDSMQQCVMNFYELLNTGLYKGVQKGASPAMQMMQIKACGYMTSSTEVNSVLKIIEKYNLTKYDSVVEQEPEGNPYMEPVALLRNGMRGDGVRWVQYQLNAKGYNLIVDGIFGTKTESAVKDFQSRADIHIDGIVGPQTRIKLAS